MKRYLALITNTFYETDFLIVQGESIEATKKMLESRPKILEVQSIWECVWEPKAAQVQEAKWDE